LSGGHDDWLKGLAASAGLLEVTGMMLITGVS